MIFLNLLYATFAADVVGVFDADFRQVFRGARPVKAAVAESSKVMEHPVETGSVITDHKIELPVAIEISFVVPSSQYRSVYQQIKQLRRDGTLLTVQTRTGSYGNMLITDIPHDEDPEMFDVLPISIKFTQVQFVTATFGKLPARKVAAGKKASTSTVPRGQTTGKQVPKGSKQESSILADIASGIGGLF